MPSYTKKLIVEGYFDKLFLDILLQSMKLKDVEVKTPQKNGIMHGGKGNAISVFVSALKLLNDGSIEKLALIVDADFSNISSQGFRKTFDEISVKVNSEGFDIKTASSKFKNGIYYKKESIGVDVAVWIMPNNGLDGYLEYLLFDAFKVTKPQIVSEAEKIIDRLQNKEYPPHHEMKAKLAISMAMLENPGRNISHLVEKNILNYSHNPVLQDFVDFLKNYFQK
jgi:hypothetical protein